MRSDTEARAERSRRWWASLTPEERAEQRRRAKEGIALKAEPPARREWRQRRDRQIAYLRTQGWTLQRIADHWGLSNGRICQIVQQTHTEEA